MMEQAHVVLHPLPVQGHIKPLLCLAKLLSESGFYVTFLVTHHTRNNLPNLSSLSTHFPNLHFESVSDGLPDDHSRVLSFEFFSQIKTKTKPHLKQFLLNSLGRKTMSSSPPVTCIITDEYSPYTLEVAEELEIPIFTFVGHSASYLLAYLSVPKLIEQGHLPFLGENKNHEINGTTAPGLEGLLRPKNLPPFCLSEYIHHPFVQSHLDRIFRMNGSSGLIINTFEDLEVKSLPHVASHFRKTYIVGPLHALKWNTKSCRNSHLLASHASHWEADQNCLPWLDSQPLKSVLYVSFGSLAKASISRLLEFWHGLVNSGHPFLWVLRPDVILCEEGEDVIVPQELRKGAKEKGHIVDWAPQEQVLGHVAIGGFLTHCGWNSILESIVARIPLICWPQTSDQNINADLVSNVMGIGLELEACDRLTIQRTVENLMGSKREELQNSIDRIAKCAQDAIGEGGSSIHNLGILVEDIKKIKIESQNVE